MRTSGGRGTEGWIIALPLIGLGMVASMRAGGVEPMLRALADTVHDAVHWAAQLVAGLF